MSKTQFKVLDLLVFSILIGLFEFINYHASVKFADVTFSFLSFTIALSLLAIYRWGMIGTLVSLPGGFVCCLAAGKLNWQTIAIYCGSFLTVIFSYLIILIFKRKTVKRNKLVLALYLLSGYIPALITRAFISYLFGYNFISLLGQFFVRDSVSIVISYIILLIASLRNGMMVEMNEYLLEAYLDKIRPIRLLRQIHQDPHFNNFDEVIPEGDYGDQNILDDGTLTSEDLKVLDQLYKSKVEKEVNSHE